MTSFLGNFKIPIGGVCKQNFIGSSRMVMACVGKFIGLGWVCGCTHDVVKDTRFVYLIIIFLEMHYKI